MKNLVPDSIRLAKAALEITHGRILTAEEYATLKLIVCSVTTFLQAETLREAADEMHAEYEAVDYGHWRGRDYAEGMEMAYAYAEDDLRACAATIEGEQ